MTQYYMFAGLLVFMVSSLVVVHTKLEKRTTYKEVDDKYVGKDVCSEVHKSVDEKLEIIPKIHTAVIQIQAILNERDKSEQKEKD